MREITSELRKRNCVICLHCGAIYEDATEEEFWGNECPNCDSGFFSWMIADMASSFWLSPAAQAMIAGKINEFKRSRSELFIF
jgi:predicted  nucleic acid-binding Zn-ribbon protein